MHPKILPRPPVWSHNTSYVGASGLHSENSPATRARKSSIDNRLNKVISVLKEMERKEFQKLDKSKREIQKSMLAYTEKVKKINAKRQLTLETSSEASATEIQSERSSQTSSGANDNSVRKGRLSPVKSRRVSLPKIRPANNRTMNKRRNSSFSDSETVIYSVARKPKGLSQRYPSRSQTVNASDNEDTKKTISENRTQNEKQESEFPMICPFPYESYDENFEPNFTSSGLNMTKSPIQSRKRISYKQYKEEKEMERERILARKQSMADIDPFDHKKEILRQQAKQKRAALVLEKARQEALKNKKDVYSTFSYSFAMEELLKKSDPLSYSASEDDFIAKVEVDQNGIVKQTLGPAVLAIIGVDELNNFQGMRIKWSAKYRPQIKSESESSDDELFLPPITVGGRKQSIARELSRRESISHDLTHKQSLSRDATQEQIHTLHLDPQSTISAVSVDG